MKKALLLLCLLSSRGLLAAEASDWFPGGTYDPTVPTFQQVLGWDPPARFTSFFETEKLLKAWATAAADRTRLIEFGEDYEGKKLYLLVVSSPENIRRLDAIRENLGKLADPRKISSPAELDSIVQSTPASFLISTIDTSEASSVEAMQVIAYQLIAGTDPLSERIRKDVVTYIVPVENPSARERYVSWYNTVSSAIPKADPNAYEHNPPWSVGNDANHYLLDPNRDGVSMLLAETRAKARLLRDWRPEVALDVHEMGVSSPFFFPPYPEPNNRNLPLEMFRKWWNLYAEDLRREFDQRGWRYFSNEVFGSPFLGQHTLYTQYLGAIGVLFEQAAGEGGLVIERPNGSLLTLRDRVQHHVTGALSMLRVTAENSVARHRDYHEFFKSSLNGVPGVAQKRYVFVPGDDANGVSAFVDKLLAHGLEVERASEEFSSARAHSYAGGAPASRRFPAGSYIVSLAQPLSRLANAILEKEPYHSLPVFYDVSVWALPYNYGIEGYWTEDALPVRTERVTEPPPVRGAVSGGRARVAYVWSYRGNQEARAAFELAAEGFKLYFSRPFKQAGVSFSPAAVVAFLQENDAEALHARIGRLAEENHIAVDALHSSHVEEGSDLGSGTLIPVAEPRVAIVTRDGVDIAAYGSFWFFFDQLYRLPFTPITIEQLKSASLKSYTTVIVPDGGLSYSRFGVSGKPYKDYLGEEGALRLKRWVEEGGTLITVKGAAEWASAEAGLAEVEYLGRTEQTPGAVVRVKVKRASPLTLGYPEEFHVLSRNTRTFRAKNPRGALVSYLEQDLKLGGYLLDADRDRIAGTDYLMAERLGDGRIILFAEEPNLRCQWPFLHRLLFNAILAGPAFR
jgi:hypothetical protein